MPNWKIVDGDSLDGTFEQIAEAVRKRNKTETRYRHRELAGAILALEAGSLAANERIYQVGTGLGDALSFPEPLLTSQVWGRLVPYRYACCDPKGANATSLTATISVKAGEWVLATVTTRSEAAFPEGWTLLYQSGVIDSNQRMAMLCRQFPEEETVSFTVTQTENDRIYINLMAVEGIQGFAFRGTATEMPEAGAGCTMVRPGCERVIWACSAVMWSTSTPYQRWTCAELDEIWLVDLGTKYQPRQANFWDEAAGATRTFLSAAEENSLLVACVEVL